MKVAITGETEIAREKLVEQAVRQGLNVMTSVSRHTSVLVANDPGSGTAKARQALNNSAEPGRGTRRCRRSEPLR
ncbi:BRCT domain-containing protein [Actinomadura sp. NAK00032]|uniref:BRCT domain-containing protein n=1 Tax=Actinomadura sp. NAK00032 TaxID=2742128 RepID=UPI001C378E6A|nr:BRCT domain-containing protein [Actinomadura sp. NAK00032]